MKNESYSFHDFFMSETRDNFDVNKELEKHGQQLVNKQLHTVDYANVDKELVTKIYELTKEGYPGSSHSDKIKNYLRNLGLTPGGTYIAISLFSWGEHYRYYHNGNIPPLDEFMKMRDFFQRKYNLTNRTIETLPHLTRQQASQTYRNPNIETYVHILKQKGMKTELPNWVYSKILSIPLPDLKSVIKLLKRINGPNLEIPFKRWGKNVILQIAKHPIRDYIRPDGIDVLNYHGVDSWKDVTKKEELFAIIRGWKLLPEAQPDIAKFIGSKDRTFAEKMAALIAWHETRHENWGSTEHNEKFFKYFDEFKTLPKSELYATAQDVSENKPSRFYSKQNLSRVFSHWFLNALGPKGTYALVMHFHNQPTASNALRSLHGLPIKALGESYQYLCHFLEDENHAAIYALGLVATFGNKWREWLNKTCRQSECMHDVIYFLPKTKPDPTLPPYLLKNAHAIHNTNALTYFEIIINNWNNVNSEDRQLPLFKLAAKIIAKTRYPNAQNHEFALEASKWGIPQSEYQDIEKSFIISLKQPDFNPNAVYQAGKYKGYFLKRKDTRGLFLGQYTNCCQYPGGVGNSCAWYGQTNRNSGFFIIENENGQIVAQSWTWISPQGLVFDNVESKGLSNEQQIIVRNIYEQAANDLAKRYGTVNVGTTNSKLSLDPWLNNPNQSYVQPPEHYDGYTDARQQITIKQEPDYQTTPVSATILHLNENDIPSVRNIAQVVYPHDWQDINYDEITTALGVFTNPGTKHENLVGYVLLDDDNKEVLDMAILPTWKKYGPMLVNAFIKHMGNDWWTATTRESTSYKLLKTYAKRGSIELQEGDVEDYMGNEKMINVRFRKK